MNANNSGNYDADHFLQAPTVLDDFSCSFYLFRWNCCWVCVCLAYFHYLNGHCDIKNHNSANQCFFWQSNGEYSLLRCWWSHYWYYFAVNIFWSIFLSIQPSFFLGLVVLVLTSYLFTLWLRRVGNFHYVILGTWDNRNHTPFVEGNRCLGLCLCKEK